MTGSSRIPERSTLRLVEVMLWLALASGLVEAAVRAVQRHGFGKILLLGPHVSWMAPLTDLLWISLAVLPALAAGRVVQRWRRPIVPLASATIVAFLALLLLVSGLHPLAALALAGGLGLQTARIAMRHQATAQRVVRVMLGPLLLLVIATGATGVILRQVSERRALAALGTPPAQAANVLLIIWDTVRGRNLSLLGYDRPTTPNLEEMAGEGTSFDLAIATAPWTLPSHGSLFTGLAPQQVLLGVDQPLDWKVPPIAEVLAAQGYVTAGFVANMAYTTREHGLDRGFVHYEDHVVSPGEVLLSSRLGTVLADWSALRRLTGFYDHPGRKHGPEITDDFLEWLRDRPDDGRPYFAFLNYFDAHRPYIAPEPFRSRFVRDAQEHFRPRPEMVRLRDISRAEVAWMADHYDGLIASLDAELGRLLDSLAADGTLDNTIVVVTSDHGEHLGDHGRLGHMNSLYRPLLRVPLVIRYPGRVPAGEVVPEPVSLRDVPRTILDVAGLTGPESWPGSSLARTWRQGRPAEPAPPIWAEIAVRPARGPYSIIARGYHYIAWPETAGLAPELYRLSDIRESNNLADSAAMAPELARFAAMVPDLMRRHTTNPGVR
ncbi:MAG: sulfatase [Gemmatimonadales bacterium]